MGVQIPRSIPEHCHPLVRELFSVMRDQEISYEYVTKKSGIGKGTLWRMRNKHSPNITTLDACLNAVGFRLAIIPIMEPRA